MYRARSTLIVVVLMAGMLLPLQPLSRARADAAAAGFRDFAYGSSVSAPTGQKPESKLWFADGSWWGGLWNKAAGQWQIHRFDPTTQSWTPTGTRLDPRRTTQADYMWAAGKLYVVSAQKAGTSGSDLRLLLFRYAYANGSYSLDAGFPVSIGSVAPEAVVFDRDSTGTLWLTYTAFGPNGKNSVFVAHSTSDDKTWTSPYLLPTTNATALAADDISTIASFGNGTAGRFVGVLYSNQSDETLNFAVHADGAPDTEWTRSVVTGGPKIPDDHLNVKALMSDDSGRLFAVVKTSLNDKSPKDPSDPLIVLWTRHMDGSWTSSTVWRVGDDITRAIVLLDSEHRVAHVFGAAPCCSGGIVYTKSAPYDQPSFPAGLGTPFIQSELDPKINNPTSTKQEVSSATGLLVEAGDDSTRYYVHGWLPLTAAGQDTTPPDTSIASGPPATGSDTSATFTFVSTEAGSSFVCGVDGGSMEPCVSPKTYDGLAIGEHTFAVAATDQAGNTDPTPASETWTITGVAQQGIVREAIATTVDTAATSAVTISTPSGTQAGDVLVACLALNGSTVRTAPQGWTRFAAVTSIANPRAFGYYRVATSSEPASATWTLNASVANAGGIARYSGVDGVSPLDGPGSQLAGPASTTPTVPGVTLSSSGDMLVGCMSANSGSATLTIAGPAGMVEAWDLAGKRHELDDAIVPAGDTGARTWTFSAARDWAGWLTALRPA
jgi:hypothetical protein